MEIRRYEEDDLEDVLALSLRAWEPVFVSVKENFDPELYDYYYPDWREHQTKDVKKVCKDPELLVWVACEGADIAGFSAIKLDKESKTGEIFMIAVDPSHQRKGISSALTEFSTDYMKEAGMEIAMVGTGADPGHGPARSSYEKSGFKPWHNVLYFKKL